ncbi:hypothetical protein FKV75_01025 [Weissella paramesenteroides]|uniref:CDP-glycerol glycerophosphotransferase family protein n=1 Tax=Weissella paramesenteroides TaxID=1249 RepID=UPI001238CB4E|nr:CDP-glycerol glycerophosphotransferase family protein [Weissella paramesenteroides]KAA8442510.1 hypothetical protein FKV77_04650 [Weissella paramesenteroides]KAA8442857.1 hypothetical protein FKV81_00640 [Weissella paramesenteroides]KAA8444468.1 hypothetical protein FKV75_01025 [Weissella paramesenteroides]KAA8448135.1 hypothetical protein FKV76_02590 [Weissella paramesenteroides]KAA8452053.1 hypothetical protein FKV74_00640 [Weissella paramesenteroides]
MENNTLNIKSIELLGEKIVLSLNENVVISEIAIQNRKQNQLIICDFKKNEENIILSIPQNLKNGRYDIFLKLQNSLDKRFRLKYNEILQFDIPDRYSLIKEFQSQKYYWYFTLDGYLAIQVINKINNGHFNQFSGKMTVDDFYEETPTSVTIDFKNSSHIFYDLQMFLMDTNSADLFPIKFNYENKRITIQKKEINYRTEKLLVIKYKHKHILQSRWLDFSKILKNNFFHKVNDISINPNSGKLNFSLLSNSSFPVTQLEFIVRNRNTREEISYLVKKSGKEFCCEIDANNFPMLPTENYKYLDEVYDGNIFDFIIRPIFEWIPFCTYRIRLNYNDNLDDEYWFRKTTEIEQLVMIYKTKIGKLAARFSYIPQSTYKYYREVKDVDGLVKDSQKKILLVSEYINKAQDTGMIFFKYMIDNHNDEFDTYYVLTKHSEDLKNLDGYMNHVVFYRSVQHLKLVMQAQYLAHSHSSIYAFPFNTKRMNKLRFDLNKVFLQHGIMGVRDLSNLYQFDRQFTNKIVVSSVREKKIAIEKLHYPKKAVGLTGLSRFDRLMKYRHESKKFDRRVLIMPSWRNGQNHLSNEEFLETDFYKEWQGLLDDVNFKNLIRSQDLVVNMYLHHNFQHYQALFHSDEVSLVKEGNVSVQDLLINHGVLITDFSSVGLDFSLLKRPVLYYDFDNLFDLTKLREEHFLPGPVINTKEDLIKKLENSIVHPKLKLKYEFYQRRNLYRYIDQSANKRIYRLLKQ